jgi:hypothetical protein
MKKKFCLITNTSNCKYWSYLGTKETTVPNGLYRRMIEKYGDIWINEQGGWFGADSVKKIHATLIQENFPPVV